MIAGLVVVIIVTWIGFWVSLISLIGRIGGWRRLAAAYPAVRQEDAAHPLQAAMHGADEARRERTFAMQCLTLRGFANYNYIVHFSVRDDGLLIDVLRLFRFGHPKILLPWSEFATRETTRLFMEVTVLTTRLEPKITLTVPRRLAQRLAQAAGDRWPQPSREA